MAGRRRSRAALAAVAVLAAVVAPALAASAPQAVDPSLLRELRWRPIGPFRGGRTKAATGVRGRPGLFYVGVVNGGVWKTTDYGRTWQPIFDDQPTGSIGAIAVAPSNPDVIYVGSGEGMQRPDLSTGDGIYKSLDAGRTWRHLGLRDGQQIPQIVVDPKDDKRLFVAVLGHPYGPNAERGIFRSTRRRSELREGAVPRREHAVPPTWPSTPRTRTSSTRCSGKRARGPGRTAPSRARAAVSTSPRTAGRSWRKLEAGLPTFAEGLGRIGITVAPSDPRRLYATVEARERGGHLPLRRRAARAGAASTPTRASSRGRATRPRCGCTRRTPTRSSSRRSWRGSRRTAAGRSRPSAARPAATTTSGSGSTPTAREVMILSADQGAIVTVNGGAELEQLVQPADRAVLPREHRQRVPVPRVRRAAGERLGVRQQPRRRRADHLPRVAPGGRRGVRLRGRGPARPGRRLRRAS